MEEEKKIINIFKTRKYIKQKRRQTYYPYYGLEIYLGAMGMGKTLSAVYRISKILEKYPQLTFISNVKIQGIEKAIYFNNSEELVEILKKIDINNNKGYLIFIDEIHVVLADLFGKTDPIFLQFLSQQRKLSIHIIGTAQMHNKLPKFIRDYLIQSGKIIICKNIFKVIQINKEVNMEEVEEDGKNNITYKTTKLIIFIHTKELYEKYDTFAVISQIQGLMKGSKENGTRLSNDIRPITEI